MCKWELRVVSYPRCRQNQSHMNCCRVFHGYRDANCDSGNPHAPRKSTTTVLDRTFNKEQTNSTSNRCSSDPCSAVTPRLISRIVFNENNLRAMQLLSVSERTTRRASSLIWLLLTKVARPPPLWGMIELFSLAAIWQQLCGVLPWVECSRKTASSCFLHQCTAHA